MPMTDNPRIALAAKLTGSGLTTEAATIAAQLAKLTAEPTDQDLADEVKRILGEAKPTDFKEGHSGAQAAFFRQYKADLLREREVEAATGTGELDKRLAGGAGSDAAELDRRLGPVRS